MQSLPLANEENGGFSARILQQDVFGVNETQRTAARSKKRQSPHAIIFRVHTEVQSPCIEKYWEGEFRVSDDEVISRESVCSSVVFF